MSETALDKLQAFPQSETQDIIALGIWVDAHCRGFEIVEDDGTVRPITNIEMYAWMAAERIGLVDGNDISGSFTSVRGGCRQTYRAGHEDGVGVDIQ